MYRLKRVSQSGSLLAMYCRVGQELSAEAMIMVPLSGVVWGRTA